VTRGSRPSIQTVDSYACSIQQLLDERLRIVSRIGNVPAANPIGVIRLVVQDEGVLLAADLAAEHALHQFRVSSVIDGMILEERRPTKSEVVSRKRGTWKDLERLLDLGLTGRETIPTLPSRPRKRVRGGGRLPAANAHLVPARH
jgi:hypothetical protein